ncbi:Beta-galactosidase YesZ [compost metagenome]
MLGSMPTGEAGEQLLNKLITHYADEAGVTLRTDVTAGTIVAPRRGDGCDVWVVVNMDGAGGSVTLPQGGIDPISGASYPEGLLTVGRYEHKVIQFRPLQ